MNKKQLQKQRLQNSFEESPALTSLAYADPAPDAPSFNERVRVESPASLEPDGSIASMPLSYFVGREVWVPCQTQFGMVENLAVRVTGIDGGELVGTLDRVRVFAVELMGVTEVRVSPRQITRVERSLVEWRTEVATLMSETDYHNPWRGLPSDWRFDQLYRDGFSPLDALELWRDWEPFEDD